MAFKTFEQCKINSNDLVNMTHYITLLIAGQGSVFTLDHITVYLKWFYGETIGEQDQRILDETFQWLKFMKANRADRPHLRVTR